MSYQQQIKPQVPILFLKILIELITKGSKKDG
jgi:hypothetical protein